MNKRAIRWTIAGILLLLLSGLLVFGFGAIIQWLYFQGFTNDSSQLVHKDILCNNGCRVVDFTFNSRDIKFYNDLKTTTLSSQNLHRQVRTEIDGTKRWVEISPYSKSQRDLNWPKGKKPFTITFPSHNYLEKVRQYHLLPIHSIDWLSQQLIYRMGALIGLAIPKTTATRVVVNDVFEGNFLMKQALDNLFLERIAAPGSVIFNIEKNNGKSPSIAYLYNEVPDTELHRHLSQFAKNASNNQDNQQEILAEKYLDLDYLARLEAIRLILQGEPGFILADNLTFVYNKTTGKLYPILDERNISNLNDSRKTAGDLLRHLAIQVTRMPRIQEGASRHQKRLSSGTNSILNHFKRTSRTFRDYSGHPGYRIKTWITSVFFKRYVYKKLLQVQSRNSKNTRETDTINVVKTPLPPLYPPIIENNNHWTVPSGEYTLSRHLHIPPGILLIVEAGVNLRLSPGISILSKSPVDIQGTAEKPVIIEALNPEKPFGVVAITGPARQSSRIRHLRFSGSGDAFIDGIIYPAGLNILYNDVEMTDSTFTNIDSNVQLAIKHSSVRMERNEFRLKENDCLVMEFCKGMIHDNRFDGQTSGRNSDAITTDHCQLLITNSIIEHFSDKGLNLGKNSVCLAVGNDIRRNGIGIAVKDRARLLVWNNRLAANNKTVAIYRQTPNFGGGSVYLLSNQLQGNRSGIEADTGSQIFRLQESDEMLRQIEAALQPRDPERLDNIFNSAILQYNYRPNRLESLEIGDTKAYIDRGNRLIIANLPPSASPKQTVTFTSSIPGSTLRVFPMATGPRGHFPGSQEPEAFSSGTTYNFQQFIFYGRLALEWRWQSEYFELFVTQGETFIPIIFIDTRNRAGNPRTIKNEPKIPCRVKVLGFPPELDTDYMGRTLDARIEGRGQKWPKWKYGFNLETAVSLLGLKRSRKWVLESSFVEKSLMRPKLAFDLLNQFHPPGNKGRVAPRSRFTEVYLDGQYQGLYLLLEHIDDDFLDLESFDKNEDHNALLYRCQNLNANYTAINTHPEESSLFRHFPNSRQLTTKARDPIFGWHSGFAQRHPEPERFGEYYQPIEEFSRFVALSTDIRFQREIFSRLDMDRYVDVWIFTQLMDDTDGLYQNRYIGRRRGRGETWYFVPWDKDGVMGRRFDMTRRPHDQWLATPLFDRCLEIPAFRTALAQRWRQLRSQGVISVESLHRAIDDTIIQISTAQQRNFAKWPPDMPQYPDSSTFDGEIEFMKDWLRRRVEWLDNRFRELAPEAILSMEEKS